MKISLILQWAGIVLIAGGVAALSGWPWGVLIAGMFVLAIGVSGERHHREELGP